MRTHYENLKISENAPPEVVSAAYRALTKQHHPDKNPDNPDADRIMRILNEAYEVLSDPSRRAHYDRLLSEERIRKAPPFNSPPPKNTQRSKDDSKTIERGSRRRILALLSHPAVILLAIWIAASVILGRKSTPSSKSVNPLSSPFQSDRPAETARVSPPSNPISTQEPTKVQSIAIPTPKPDTSPAKSPIEEETAPPATDEKPSLTELAKAVLPSVVRIVTYDENGDSLASGSGFIVRKDGVIATNRHVVEGASSARILRQNGSELLFEGVLHSPIDEDIALLKVGSGELAALPLEDATSVEMGEAVAVVGSPLGFEGTLTTGIISAVRRKETHLSEILLRSQMEIDFLQISAPISKGSSGSPVVNERGRVVGIATAKIKGGENLNVALPVRHIRHLLAVTAGNRPIPLSQAFPVTQAPVVATPLAPSETPAEPVEDNFGKAVGVALSYLRLGDSESSDGRGYRWYSDPVSYFDKGVVPLSEAIRIESNYESRWPLRIHTPLDRPIAEEAEKGVWEVAVTSVFAISDGKRDHKQIVVTTGFLISVFPAREILSVRTVSSESKKLNKWQFKRLYEQIGRDRMAWFGY